MIRVTVRFFECYSDRPDGPNASDTMVNKSRHGVPKTNRSSPELLKWSTGNML